MASLFAEAALALSRPPRRRRWLLLALAVAASGYGAYRVYHLPSVARRRRRLARLLHAVVALADAASASADAAALVSGDLNRFLRSDSDEIPTSLRQASKIAMSEDFSSSVSALSEAVTRGVLRGSVSGSDSSTEPLSDRLLDKLFSPAGSSFASVVVGSFARNLVVAHHSAVPSGESAEDPRWLQVVFGERGKELAANWIQVFVSTAVAAYLDRTMAINTFDEALSSITNPKHEAKVKDLLVSLSNGAVETLVRTSHQVITSSSSSSSKTPVELVAREAIESNSAALVVPGNRRLVLDVTGRVTSEMVRSFLDFVLRGVSDGVKKSVHGAHHEVVERGLMVVRYLSAKSMAIFTICLALCMHISIGTRLIVPA